MLVCLNELGVRLDLQSFDLLDEFLNLLQSRFLALDDHIIDLVHLALVPFYFGLIVVASRFEELAGLQHFLVLVYE